MKWYQKIFSFLKRKPQVKPNIVLKKEKKPLGFTQELQELKKKLVDFFLTRKVVSGKVVERTHYTLTKTGEELYKLEGKDKSGFTYSIVISTGNFLSKKNGVVVGVIQVNEGELNRAIQREFSSLESFLGEFSGLNLSEKSWEAIGIQKPKFHWKEVLSWDTFWKEQLIRHLRPNTLALLLVTLDDDFMKMFSQYATPKQKKIISDELFYLNQGVNSKESNPNTKNFNLQDSNKAIQEFQELVEKLKTKRGEEISERKLSSLTN